MDLGFERLAIVAGCLCGLAGALASCARHGRATLVPVVRLVAAVLVRLIPLALVVTGARRFEQLRRRLVTVTPA